MQSPNTSPADEERLMAELAAGRQEALNELMLRWQAPLFRFIERAVRDAGAAEELTQETFYRLWRARADYHPGGKFSTWLFRIASRLCLDLFRRRARRPTLIGSDESTFHQAPAPQRDRADAGVLEGELREALARALERLPPRQRLALELNRFEDLSYREIAEVLGCSVGSVEQFIFRARRRLREELAEFLPPAEALAHGGRSPSTAKPPAVEAPEPGGTG